uniref:CARD domain-containing protein n=1 Tax=Oryzias sinensis TaxID=183150 RepID=A0A8C7ZET3_9TELE
MVHMRIMDTESCDEQLLNDAPFLCSDQRMDAELVDRLVLQLNRVYPQILSDKEACKFRSLSVPTKVQLHQLLKHLREKGEESCLEFYGALHIHAEDIYRDLPTRIRQREMADSNWTNSLAAPQKSYGLNDKGSRVSSPGQSHYSNGEGSSKACKMMLSLELPGNRARGRPKRRFMDAEDSVRWRKQIFRWRLLKGKTERKRRRSKA